MSLFAGPAEHAGNPPESWTVTKAGRVWHLCTAGGGVLGSYPTRRAAEQDRASGPYVELYADEARWYAGESVRGWKPYRATLPGPQGGDAVRLAVPWMGVDAGAIGVMGGYVGQVPEDATTSICFRAHTFRGRGAYPYDGTARQVVSCSGGPATIATDIADLAPTGDTITLRVWRWDHRGPGAGHGEDYTVTVPVWEWTPAH